ncbi:MAG: hypothetical protein NWQ55_12030 [Salibacteraceae bacterium]|jgi:HPt (histidine-containing phosphotransfer) domain-containing protein|nr:hypothetical protein [Salibacteraceae bacterium]MDP4935504.1 hypothetical protein [Salibacteraceae bacterium]MDP4965798.1 hypothetical protein [Salibacteraceae bacterium]
MINSTLITVGATSEFESLLRSFLSNQHPVLSYLSCGQEGLRGLLTQTPQVIIFDTSNVSELRSLIDQGIIAEIRKQGSYALIIAFIQESEHAKALPIAVGFQINLMIKGVEAYQEVSNLLYQEIERNWNWSFLESFTGNNKAKMSRYIGMYLISAPPIINRMIEHLVNQDWGKLAIEAHSLIPQTEFMGIEALRDIITEIEVRVIKNNYSGLHILCQRAFDIYEYSLVYLTDKLNQLREE